MRITLLIVISLFFSVLSFGQKKKRLLPVENEFSNRYGKKYNYSFAERLKKYPYNKVVKIQLVSFDDPTGGGQVKDKTKIVFNKNMPKSYMAVCINPFKETKTLNLAQIDKLSNIWFNYKPLGDTHGASFSPCYSPRNAILFLNEKEEVFDFIEICFQCQHMYDFSKKINAEDECDHKIKMIKTFFKSVGIKYGVVSEK